MSLGYEQWLREERHIKHLSNPNSSRGKKVSQDAEREKERKKKDPTSCFQLPAM